MCINMQSKDRDGVVYSQADAMRLNYVALKRE